jgi:hypothetical protein
MASTVGSGWRQPGLGVDGQGADKDALGRRGRAAVAATGVAHLTPVGGAVDRAVTPLRVDEGPQQ